MTASSGEVAATAGGTELLNPCGMSTHTYGRWWDARSSSVSSRFSSLSHDLWRNSTQMRGGLARSAHSTAECLFERRIVDRGGGWGHHAARLAPARQWCERIEEARSEVLDRVLVQILRVHALLALGSNLLRE